MTWYMYVRDFHRKRNFSPSSSGGGGGRIRIQHCLQAAQSKQLWKAGLVKVDDWSKKTSFAYKVDICPTAIDLTNFFSLLLFSFLPSITQFLSWIPSWMVGFPWRTSTKSTKNQVVKRNLPKWDEREKTGPNDFKRKWMQDHIRHERQRTFLYHFNHLLEPRRWWRRKEHSLHSLHKLRTKSTIFFLELLLEFSPFQLRRIRK